MLSDGTRRLTRIRYLELASFAKAFKEVRGESKTHQIAADAINDLMDEVDALTRDLATERKQRAEENLART